MKHKFLKLNLVLLLGFYHAPLQSQPKVTVKTTVGTQITYTLSNIRKLTFPSTENMTVIKSNGIIDNYILNEIDNLTFSTTETGFETHLLTEKKILFYPNPVIDMLNIQLLANEGQTTTIELFSIEGKNIYKIKLNTVNNIHQINMSQFRKGIYLCYISNGSNIITTKIIKQ